MTTAEIVAACGERVDRPFLVIGGHAVMGHGYARNTVDLDLLIRKADRGSWVEGLNAIGYRREHAHENFEQYRSMKEDIDLDLMMVNERTFDGMWASAREMNVGSMTFFIPSLGHLIALKLHVLKQGLEHRMLGDLDDVVQLVLVNGIDLDQREWKEIFEKYGTPELYEKVRHATRSG